MSVDQGEHWSTVDDFSFSGLGSQANAIAFGPNGEAYVIGTASDSSQEHWIVRKSPLGGQNWSTVDDLPLPDSNIWTVSLIAGSDGGIYAIGNWNNWHGGATHWLARKSDPKTGLWATVDDFQPSGPSYPVPRTAVRDSNGNIYVAGILNGPSVVQGIVRKSADQGATWATINIPVSSIDGTDGGTFYMDSDSAGNLYLVTASSQKITSGYNYTWNFDWVVQTSPDGALTWNLSDDVFQSGASYQGTATLTGFGQGIPGHFFLIGSGSYLTNYNGPKSMTVISSTNSGSSWQQSWPGALPIQAYTIPAFRVDSNDNFYIGLGESGRAGHWKLLKSSDKGISWSIVDDYVYPVQDPPTNDYCG